MVIDFVFKSWISLYATSYGHVDTSINQLTATVGLGDILFGSIHLFSNLKDTISENGTNYEEAIQEWRPFFTFSLWQRDLHWHPVHDLCVVVHRPRPNWGTTGIPTVAVCF